MTAYDDLEKAARLADEAWEKFLRYKNSINANSIYQDYQIAQRYLYSLATPAVILALLEEMKRRRARVEELETGLGLTPSVTLQEKQP